MNFALESVVVTGDELDPTVLVAAVEAIGYGLTATDGAAPAVEQVEPSARSNSWLPRVLVAWPLAIAVLVLSIGFMDEPGAVLGARVVRPQCSSGRGGRFCIRPPCGPAAVRRTWTP